MCIKRVSDISQSSPAYQCSSPGQRLLEPHKVFLKLQSRQVQLETIGESLHVGDDAELCRDETKEMMRCGGREDVIVEDRLGRETNSLTMIVDIKLCEDEGTVDRSKQWSSLLNT